MKYLICGLGNIGPEYAQTRHNIGFMVLDYIAQKNQVSFEFKKLAYVAEFKFKGKLIVLVKPTTYMNLSGKALNYYLQEYKIPVENSLTITDDIALPFGKLRLRPKGSNGGHNGLGNIQEVLNSDVYPRMRFGIDGNFSKGKQVDYVLGNFSSSEEAELALHIERATQAVYAFVSIGLERCMNEYNK